MSGKVLQRAFQKLLGQVCWEIAYKRCNLSFNFGKPRLVFKECKDDPIKDRQVRKYTCVRAEWFFWIYRAYWKLSVFNISGNKKLTAIYSSTLRQKKEVCPLLCGQRLIHISIDNKTGKTSLLFDLGAELIVRRPSAKTKELWLLYEPNGYCLSLHGDGTYDHELASGTDKRPSFKNKPIPKSVVVGPRAT